MKYSIEKIRREYEGKRLEKEPLQDPLQQFLIWFEEAITSDIEPNAMVLSTVSPLGHPSSRNVLLKKIDRSGFHFFTDQRSRKAEQLETNPFASGAFLWKNMHAQVLVEGKVKKISRKECREYFAKRPKGAQIAAIASCQSHPLSSREALLDIFKTYQTKFKHKKVPCPAHWVGYCLVPHRIEFWQGRKNRLHDRILYVKEGKQWIITRLSP